MQSTALKVLLCRFLVTTPTDHHRRSSQPKIHCQERDPMVLHGTTASQLKSYKYRNRARFSKVFGARLPSQGLRTCCRGCRLCVSRHGGRFRDPWSLLVAAGRYRLGLSQSGSSAVGILLPTRSHVLYQLEIARA